MKIYTDGACRGNGKQENWGAWSFVVVKDDVEIAVGSGFKPSTTNNKMELTAAIRAMQWFQENHPTITPTVISDSQYVVKGITDWVHGWLRKNWRMSTGKPVANKEQWQHLLILQTETPAIWEWVRGHDGDKYNEMCDKMCNDALDKLNQ